MPRYTDQTPHAIREVENIWVPMPDGTRLAAKLWLPEDAEANPVPALLEYLPYRKRDGTRLRDAKTHRYVAGHGYACVRLDIRGCGDSEGVLADEYTGQEQEDGVAAIEWLAKQPWCDGQVAMIGISWGGFNGLQIAARQPPALKTIITVGSTDDRYATDIHWVGGCLSKDNFDWSATMFALQDQPPDPAIVGDAWRDMWRQRIEANAPWILTWLSHQRRDDYWKQGSVCEDFSRIRIPVCAVSGWADNYSEAVPRLLAGLAGPRRGLIGPWAHSYPYDGPVEPTIDWLGEVVRWLDHWLKGRDTGVMDEPMLRAWMQESVPPTTCFRERPGRWVGEAEWPSPRIHPKALHPAPGGRLADAPANGVEIICSPLWVGAAAGEIGRYGGDAEWPTDQREDDGGSLVWRTDRLPERLEILGAPRLRLRFSSDKPQALVAVRLNDVAPDGASTRVTVGLLNLTHRDSHEHPEPLDPGRSYETEVELDDIAHAFPAGHRIAVALSTTYWPIAWPSPELATLTVDLAGTRLDLPVRPPDRADERLRPFGDAVCGEPTPTVRHSSPDGVRRTVQRDLLSGRITVDFPRKDGVVEMTDIGQTTSSNGYSRYTITDGDPLSGRIDTGYRVEIHRPHGVVLHESRGAMICDATHFTIEVELRVSDDGREINRRTWTERIARDMV